MVKTDLEALQAAGTSIGIGRLYQEIQNAHAEILALRAVVSRLPHTADGVPLVPETIFWIYDKEEGAFKYKVGKLAVSWSKPGCISTWVQDDCHRMTYSTKALAEAAAASAAKGGEG